MENFTFYSPTYFVFGKETEAQAGSLIRRFGGTRALIHYGTARISSVSSLRSMTVHTVQALP